MEAIDDNKLPVSILTSFLGDYGWIKEQIDEIGSITGWWTLSQQRTGSF